MLLHSKLRSWLTIIGIFIGVAAVVTIISLGQGLQTTVNSQIAGLGQDIITIMPGSSSVFGRGSSTTNIQPLTDQDIQALKSVPGISFISGIVSGRATIKFQNENISLTIEGQDPSTFKEFQTAAIEKGRYLSSGDSGVVVIGHEIAYNTFSKSVDVGSILGINEKQFRVIGILNASGGLGTSDMLIAMTTKDAREILINSTNLKSNEYSSIQIKVTDPALINETSNAIENALINSHHVTKAKEDFTIISAQALQARFSTITAGITLFLGIIAGISLLVGGIGVANTMFTSVLEKTRDIGVMKAIGAKNSDILLIFLFNSGMLGLVGGVLGILFAEVIALFIPLLGASLGGSFKITISFTLILIGIIFPDSNPSMP